MSGRAHTCGVIRYRIFHKTKRDDKATAAIKRAPLGNEANSFSSYFSEISTIFVCNENRNSTSRRLLAWIFENSCDSDMKRKVHVQNTREKVNLWLRAYWTRTRVRVCACVLKDGGCMYVRMCVCLRVSVYIYTRAYV